MSKKEQRAALIARAESLLQKKPYTNEDTALFNSLMKLSDAMLIEGESSNTDEQRKASLRFRDAVRGESMTGSGEPALLANDFSAKMAQLMLAAGPIYFGSPLLTNIERSDMSPTKVPVSTDLGVGYTQTEAGAVTEQELNFASVNMTKNTISSGIILVSQDLCFDLESWTTVEALIQRTASARLSRRQNQMFIPQIVTALAANSTGSVTSATTGAIGAVDIASLVASVNAQYRSSQSAGFLLNSDTARQIYDIVGTDGLRIFKHVLDPKPTLLNYPCFISDYADSIATGNHPLIFGSWEYLYSRHIPGFELQVLSKRYATDGYQGLIIRQRGDIQYSVPSTSDSALKMLTIS
jgi:HK97 family phage major capsid protein